MKSNIRSFDDFCKHLVNLRFVPETVIDIGVAWGTDELYSAFPNAYFYLVEPISYFHDVIERRLANGLNGELLPYALSDTPGVLQVKVREDEISLAGASIVHPLQEKGTLDYRVEVRELDDLLGDRDLQRPLLVKIDAQGSDVNIIKSGKEVIIQADIVICESNLFNSESDNLVSSAIIEMKSLGFDLYDIIDPLYRPRDSALSQVDLAFVRHGHSLRSYGGW